MPPQRRNQGPAPSYQPTSPRASNRQRQSIARAAAASKGRGRGVVGDDQAPSPSFSSSLAPPAPLPNDGPIIDNDDRDVAADIPTPSLPTMWSRRVKLYLSSSPIGAYIVCLYLVVSLNIISSIKTSCFAIM